MAKPLVAVVGRPNVGKSTFFNKMAGRRVSIVNDMPGVTRDRIYADTEWCGHAFTLVDTGGLEYHSEDVMWQHIRLQAQLAVDIATVVLFFVDAKQGLAPDDYEIATYLRRSGKPVVLAVNKVDGPDNSAIYDFYRLDLGQPYPVSAEHSLGLGDLLDALVEHFPSEHEQEDEQQGLRIAVIGKPNSGKSSLVNSLLGYQRVIVSDLAGTTRDAIDTPFTFAGKRYTLIDTAGIRKKSKVEEDVEYYSVVRAIAAIKRADVVLIVIDATMNVTEQDVKIAGLAHEAGKPSVVVFNKWDLVEKDTATAHRYEERLRSELKFMDYLKCVFLSAKTGKRVNTLPQAVDLVYQNASRRVSTGLLNDVIGDAISVNEPPNRNGKKLKIFYATQPSVCPPTFILFVNDASIMHFSYKRYLENALRKAFDFSGTPIRIALRNNDDPDTFEKK